LLVPSKGPKNRSLRREVVFSREEPRMDLAKSALSLVRRKSDETITGGCSNWWRNSFQTQTNLVPAPGCQTVLVYSPFWITDDYALLIGFAFPMTKSKITISHDFHSEMTSFCYQVYF
jgi:hypothetical protein